MAETGTRGNQPPVTPDEIALCNLFAELLEVDQVYADDDFFKLGGHSQLAVRLVVRIRSRLQVNVAVADVFDHPDPAGLATCFKRSEVDGPKLRPMSPRAAGEDAG